MFVNEETFLNKSCLMIIETTTIKVLLLVASLRQLPSRALEACYKDGLKPVEAYQAYDNRVPRRSLKIFNYLL